MHLIGILDSPYVRRTAIAGTVLGVPFTHESVSVFRHMDRFREVNPVIKSPSAVAADGTVLMESALIIQHMEDLAGRSLWPAEPSARVKDLRRAGLSIAAMEKSISVEYERKRPGEFHYQPWLDRVRGQLAEALKGLEQAASTDWKDGEFLFTHGAIGAAVAWGFIQFTTPDLAGPADYPALAAFAGRAEATAPFRRWPIDME